MKLPLKRLVNASTRAHGVKCSAAALRDLSGILHTHLCLVLSVAVRMCEHRGGKRISLKDIEAACDIHSGKYRTQYELDVSINTSSFLFFRTLLRPVVSSVWKCLNALV